MRRKKKVQRKKKAAQKIQRKKKIARASTHKVRVGKLLGLMYERDGEKFLHKFKSKHPSLYCDMTGTKMYIDGGVFRWTPFGVE